MPSTLEPLSTFKKDLLVLSGLTQDGARPHGDGGGDHARSAAAFFTGCHPRKRTAPISKLASRPTKSLPEIGGRTRFPSLEIGCERGQQAGNCDSGYSCAYSSNISWRSEATPMAKEVNPQAGLRAAVWQRRHGRQRRKPGQADRSIARAFWTSS